MSKKILIVDDEKSIANAMQTKLKKERPDFEVQLAHDGREGLKLAKEMLPDLILLDIIMPNLDGISTLEELRKDDTTKSIPVVILTNLASPGEKEKVQEFGIKDYLIKSNWTLADLLRKIDEVLK
jgi:two-component system, sensor histidine kinase and response regulator